MTLEQIVEEARHWPPDQIAELVDRLERELQPAPEIEAAWRAETRRRLAEIESGQVKLVPGEVVSARIRRIVQK
ncbi:MAG: addiction module protein [Verrucomicrobiota bacterium]